MKHLRSAAVLLAATLLAASCSSDGGSGPLFGTDASGSPVTTVPTETTTTAPAAPAAPLPIREGLGTFDHYVWTIEVATTGPTAGESSVTTEEWTFNRDPESRISRTRSVTVDPESPEPEESVTELYQVEGEACQWDGESWTHTVSTSQEQEVLDALQRLADVVIVPESPIVIGEETVAGITATHYRFSVSGFGAESGALVTANQVDYWLSAMGVVLRYEMNLESRSGPSDDPSATVYGVRVTAELLSADVPIPVELSPDCLALPPEDA